MKVVIQEVSSLMTVFLSDALGEITGRWIQQKGNCYRFQMLYNGFLVFGLDELLAY